MTGNRGEPQRTKNGAGNGNKSQELGEAQGRKIGSVQQKRVNGKEEGKQRKNSDATQVKRTREKEQEENKEDKLHDASEGGTKERDRRRIKIGSV